jgi:hypothetical protein
MAYDSARQRVVLFGGSSNFAEEGDTWTLDTHVKSLSRCWKNEQTFLAEGLHTCDEEDTSTMILSDVNLAKPRVSAACNKDSGNGTDPLHLPLAQPTQVTAARKRRWQILPPCARPQHPMIPRGSRGCRAKLHRVGRCVSSGGGQRTQGRPLLIAQNFGEVFFHPAEKAMAQEIDRVP